MSAIWTPRGLIVNDRGLNPQLPLVADVDDLGNVVYRQRLSGELAVDLDLKDFPFDTQNLLIDVISYQYRPDEIQICCRNSLFHPPKSESIANHFQEKGALYSCKL